MDRTETLSLLEKAVEAGPYAWAELGSGDGAFTLALRELAGPEAEIYSIDKNAFRLSNQKQAYEKEFGLQNVTFAKDDFTKPLKSMTFDGILMANSLHFIKERNALLAMLRAHLKPNGRLVIVEYDTDESNAFVPHPFSYETFAQFIMPLGFEEPLLLATAPSQYWNQMYSAMAKRASRKS